MSFVPVKPVRGWPMPCSDRARLLPPAFNAAGGLASGGRLVPMGHVSAPDPEVSTPIETHGGFEPLPERGAGSGRPD